ncbi:MAG TPA: ABC transporter permease [Actinomycetota bacterium]|nr:ABC transporter permease [Actinomycetota bacterium]
MATLTVEPHGPVRRLSAWLHRRGGLKLFLLLLPPLGWMVVVYLGALTLLFLSAFWRLDPFTSLIQRDWGLQNFRTLIEESVYRTIALRTLEIAAAVTITDIVLAFPLAYYAARMATRRMKAVLLVAVILPLWSSYLVRVFAWKVILQGNGFLDWLLAKAGLDLTVGNSQWALWLVFCYLWLPFVILPIYAALERVPDSYLEASSDLGATGWTTFRRVIWPLAFPGVVAGSIFSFSLTLGDYIAPTLVGNTRFIGNVVYESVGVSGNVPFAAAYALVPVAIMAIYLVLARRLGAFEAL